MAKINLNIEAEGTDDFYETLSRLVKGAPWRDGIGTVSSGHVQSGTASTGKQGEKPVEDWKPVATMEYEFTPSTPQGAYNEIKSEEIAARSEPDENAELDAHGHPWSDIYADSKLKTTAGLWRMKKGNERPAPMPGYPKEEASTTEEPVTEQQVEEVPVTEEPEAPADDEAEMWADAAGTEAPAVPEREWTDADLSKLCNQAAKALEASGGVPKLKELVAVYSASGTVPHSRNIPVEDRERFAGEVEALANVKYEG